MLEFEYSILQISKIEYIFNNQFILILGAALNQNNPAFENTTNTHPDLFSGIQHVIWDWNGTLLNDLDLCISIINNMLKTRGMLSISKERYLDIFDFPVQNYYLALGFDFSTEPFETISTEFITAYEQGRPGCFLMDGSKEILSLISSQGISQSILSASKSSYLKQAVVSHGIQDHFTSIHGLDNHHAAGKLSLAREYMAVYPMNPVSVLLIGDTIHDAEIAIDSGINCVLVPNGHQSRKRLSAAGIPLSESLEVLYSSLKG